MAVAQGRLTAAHIDLMYKKARRLAGKVYVIGDLKVSFIFWDNYEIDGYKLRSDFGLKQLLILTSMPKLTT